MIFAPTIWYSRTNGSVYCIWSWTPFQTDPDPVKTRPVETRRFSEYQTRGFLGSMGKYHRPRLLQRRWRPAPPGQDISLVCKHRTPAQITQVPTGCQSNQSKAPFKGVESTGGPALDWGAFQALEPVDSSLDGWIKTLASGGEVSGCYATLWFIDLTEPNQLGTSTSLPNNQLGHLLEDVHRPPGGPSYHADRHPRRNPRQHLHRIVTSLLTCWFEERIR